MSGIRMIRSSVTRLGALRTTRRLSGMQVPVDLLGERAAHALDLGELVDGRRLHALQAAEMREQFLPAPRADARDRGQAGRGARLVAPRAVAHDREAVRLVA